MSNIAKDLCGTCEAIAMSIIPKFLTREDMFLCQEQAAVPTTISPITATLLYHWTVLNDSTSAPSASGLLRPEASLFGALLSAGECIATDVVLAGQ